MATQFKNKTYHTLNRNLLDRTMCLSKYSAVDDVLRELNQVAGVTETLVHGAWQGITESPVPAKENVLEDPEGLSFLTVRYVTATNAPIINCPTCGELMVQGGACRWQDEHDHDDVDRRLAV